MDFVALDIETTSGDQEGLMIQLGMAYQGGKLFVEDITYPLHHARAYEIEAEALEVNGFTLDRIFTLNAPSNLKDIERQAIEAILDWFPLSQEQIDAINHEAQRRGGLNPDDYFRMKTDFYKKRFIPVGWNVAGFDMPYIKREMPELAQMFHYRSVDLGAVCYTLSEVFKPAGIWDYKDLKESSKLHAEAEFQKYFPDREGTWHDAGYDAMASLFSWDFLKGIIERHPDD